MQIRPINKKFLEDMSDAWDTCQYPHSPMSHIISRKEFEEFLGIKEKSRRIAFNCIGTVKFDVEDTHAVFYMIVADKSILFPTTLNFKYIRLVDGYHDFTLDILDKETFEKLGLL